MIHLSKETELAVDEILARATTYFVDEAHLAPVDRSKCCVSFEGGGGYVTVSALCKDQGHCSIEIESREWDYWARDFLRRF